MPKTLKNKRSSCVTSNAWANKIVRSGVMPANQFIPSPDNWRIHPHTQEEVLVGVLDRVGWIQNVIVSKRSGYVIDGHLRVQAALSRGEDTPVPFVEVDVTENEEALLLSAIDPIAGMAGTDHKKRSELLDVLPEDLRTLTAVLREDRKRVKVVAFDTSENYRVVVECHTASDQEALLIRLTDEGFTCRTE